MALGSSDEPAQPEDSGTERLRAAFAARKERSRQWADGEYPRAAYDAVDVLVERVRPPKRLADGWRAHIESVVRDAALADPADAQVISAAIEPQLVKTRASVDRPAVTALPTVMVDPGVLKSVTAMSGLVSGANVNALQQVAMATAHATAPLSGVDMSALQHVLKATAHATAPFSGVDMSALTTAVKTAVESTGLLSMIDTSVLDRIAKPLVDLSGLLSMIDTSGLMSVVETPAFDGLVKSIADAGEFDDITRQMAAALAGAVREADAPEVVIDPAAPERRADVDLDNREWVFVVAMAEVVRQCALAQAGVTDAQAALIMLAAIWALSTAWARERRRQG